MSALFVSAEEFAATDFNPCEQVGAAPVYGIVAGGISFAYAQEALRQLTADAQAAGAAMPSVSLITANWYAVSFPRISGNFFC